MGENNPQSHHLTRREANSLVALASLFSCALVTSNLIGSKLVLVGSVTVSAGLFVFPFTFITLDIVTERFGRETAALIVKIGIMLQVFTLIFLTVGALLPSSPQRDLGDAYARMFSLAPRMILASITAYGVSQAVEVYAFSALKQKLHGKMLLLRANLATYASQALDTAIFITIFLGHVLPFTELSKTFLAAYFSKIIVGTIDSPLVNLGVWSVNRYCKRQESTLAG